MFKSEASRLESRGGWVVPWGSKTCLGSGDTKFSHLLTYSRYATRCSGRLGLPRTGSRIQIFVDRAKVMFGHILINWPRHDLKQVAVTVHRGKTGSIGSARAWWMEVIEIRTMPHNFNKLFKRVATFRQARFIWIHFAR